LFSDSLLKDKFDDEEEDSFFLRKSNQNQSLTHSMQTGRKTIYHALNRSSTKLGFGVPNTKSPGDKAKELLQ
jgi:hypothetical protein